MTTPAEAKRVVIAAVVITGILTAFGEFTKNAVPRPRLAIAGAVVGVTLAATAEVAPQLAKSAALLMVATSVLLDGSPAIQAIGRFAGTQTPDPFNKSLWPTPPPTPASTPSVSLP